MVIKDYIFKIRINIGKYFDAEDDAAYIVCRELKASELLELQALLSDKGERASLEFIWKLLPELIVEHNLESDKGRIEAKEVAAIILEKSMLAADVAGKFIEQNMNPFQRIATAELSPQL